MPNTGASELLMIIFMTTFQFGTPLLLIAILFVLFRIARRLDRIGRLLQDRDLRDLHNQQSSPDR